MLMLVDTAAELVTAGAALGAMRMVVGAAVLLPLELLACSVKVKSPLALGVPVICPVLAFRLKPPGNAPALTT